MKSLQSSLSTRLQSLKESPKSKITNKRQYWIKQFLDTLNRDRGDFKPLTPSRLGVMLRYVASDDLEGFYEESKEPCRIWGARCS